MLKNNVTLNAHNLQLPARQRVRARQNEESPLLGAFERYPQMKGESEGDQVQNPGSQASGGPTTVMAP
jgi:hypothetical protein